MAVRNQFGLKGGAHECLRAGCRISVGFAGSCGFYRVNSLLLPDVLVAGCSRPEKPVPLRGSQEASLSFFAGSFLDLSILLINLAGGGALFTRSDRRTGTTC